MVITLALGIGANATIFTWIKAALLALLADLPSIERPEELVEIWGATRNNSALSLSYLDYLDLRDRNQNGVFSLRWQFSWQDPCADCAPYRLIPLNDRPRPGSHIQIG